MTKHLRFSGADADTQREALETIIRAQPVLMEVLDGLRALALPDHLLVAGAIYNEVWNVLTGRPALTGVNDIDVFYFDASDTGWDAEDRVIKALDQRFADLPVPVQVRNQARVHLWFENRFGEPYDALPDTDTALSRFVAPAFAIGIRLEDDDSFSVAAPFGLDDMFAMVLRPNPHRPLARGWHKAVASARDRWPELRIET